MELSSKELLFRSILLEVCGLLLLIPVGKMGGGWGAREYVPLRYVIT